MALLSEKKREAIRERLKELSNPVRLVHFTQELECASCAETRRLLEELAALSEMITLEVYNFQLDADKVRQYGVDKVPATAVVGEKDYGIRLYGALVGYEFAVLLEDILLVSSGGARLAAETLECLRSLAQPMHLEVLVTPRCPYCPAVARMAHQLALASEWITADVVAATEYPDLVMRYAVRGVPKTVINEMHGIEGAVPESEFVAAVMQTARRDQRAAMRDAQKTESLRATRDL